MTKQKQRNNRRIYYGPEGRETSLWWTVKVSPAKSSVNINGEVLHALRATPGVTIGCGLSNMAVDNAEAFPHPVYLASFTKSTALLVDRLNKDGSPAHAVLYQHRYKHITDANDARTLKRMVKEDPTVMQREFTLSVPRQSNPSGKTAGQTPRDRKGSRGNDGKTFMPRGALQRAVRAGRVGAHVARQFSDVASRKEHVGANA